MNFTPTQEQLTILKEFNNHRVMKINAVAGNGYKLQRLRTKLSQLNKAG